MSPTCSHNLIRFVIDLQDFSSSWDIRATPMFFLKNGQQIGKLVGANKHELEKESASSRWWHRSCRMRAPAAAVERRCRALSCFLAAPAPLAGDANAMRASRDSLEAASTGSRLPARRISPRRLRHVGLLSSTPCHLAFFCPVVHWVGCSCHLQHSVPLTQRLGIFCGSR